MDADAIEFVNAEQIVIKSEVFTEDNHFEAINTETELNANNVKCGEIFIDDNLELVLICGYCGYNDRNISDFGDHIRSYHNSFGEDQLKIKGEFTPTPEDETSLIEVLEDYKEETVDLSKTAKRRKSKFFCKKCNKTYRYRLRFKQHKCLKNACNEKQPLNLKQSGEASFESTVESNPLNTALALATVNFAKLTDEHNAINNVLNIPHIHEILKKNVQNSELFCDICLRQFKYKYAFRRHGMQHELSPKALQKDPNYRKCIYCGLTFTNNSEWFLHEAQHPKKGVIHCLHCPKMFKTLIELETHSKKHTGQGLVKCDQCDLSFSQARNLASHINRVHLRLKPYPCQLCDKKFVRRVELSVHMRRHTGERPYQCEECGRSFMISTLLNEHLKRHANVRDVKCPVCPMAFFTKKMMRKHMVKHSTERPFVCPTCGNNFSRKKALLAHKKIHLDVKQYVCNLCGKAFAQHAGLYMHKKTHIHSVDS